MDFYKQGFAANPSTLNPENFRSEEQQDQLVEMAQVVTRKGNWCPSHAMIDKSQAEYNALKNGKHWTVKLGQFTQAWLP